MNNKVANPKGLGFGVLAIAFWMYSLAHSGLVHPAGIDPGTMHMAMALATLGLLIAGIMAFLRHEGWSAFFFLFWAGLAWGSMHGMGHEMMGATREFNGWFAIAITLVNLYLWFGAFKDKKLGGAVALTVLLFWLSLLGLGLSFFFNAVALERIGGILGLIGAVVAFYVSAGSMCPMNLPGLPKEDNAG
jgi:succinate-acetate transporter protein